MKNSIKISTAILTPVLVDVADHFSPDYVSWSMWVLTGALYCVWVLFSITGGVSHD